MNIKDSQIHAMVREFAALRDTSVNDAVLQALRAELDRCRTAAPGQEEWARREALLQRLNRCGDLP